MHKKPSSEFYSAPRLLSSTEVGTFQLPGEEHGTAVVGEQLSVLLEREVCLDPTLALLIAIEICRLLAPAHRKGIRHGALSPDMIVVQKTEQVYRSVRVLSPGAGGAAAGPEMQFRQSNLLFGKDNFSAPEQPQRADYRTDVYSIGCILYTMLTGVPPHHMGNGRFAAGNAADGLNGCYIPKELESVIGRCLKADPKERYPNADQLLLALQSCFDAMDFCESIVSRKRDSWLRKSLKAITKQCKTNTIPISIAVAALLVASVGLFKHYSHAEQAVAMQQGKIFYNKDKQSFVQGERLELTVLPPKSSKPLLFYITEENSVVPFLVDNTGEQRDGGITISSVSGRTMHVDASKGTLVLVCLKESEQAKLKEQLLRESERQQTAGLSLKIDGKELLDRVISLKQKSPGSISITIESAPAASTETVITQDQ